MRALSKFLPENFDSSKPIGLIAGRGVYPKLIADRARSNGIEIRLIAFEGEATDELYYSFPEDQRARINVGKVGKWLKALRRFNCGYTIAAGQVKPGKLFRGLTPDIKAASLLVNLKRKNAHTIFRAIADELTANGQTSLDARAFLDEDLATKGWMTPQFAKIEDTYLQHGIEIATEMARLDVGQGVVVRKGTVIAVWTSQPHLFFDVPVFGLRTLEIMKEAGIRAAILKADSVIILEKEVTLSEAKKAKIQLFGF